MDRMGCVFLILCAIIIVISLLESKGDNPKAIKLEKGLFHTSFKFNIAAMGIIIILAFLYTIFW
jgi:SSS family solute:Na+ symporter